MVSSKATTVAGYLESLPPDRRSAVTALRKVIKKNLPDGFVEEMQYGMIGYNVPLSRYPETYNGQPLALACIASQKNHLSLYLMSIYTDEMRDWFVGEWKKSGKKLDMGKACIRFKTSDDLPLDVVGRTIALLSVDRYIAMTEAARAGARSPPKNKKPRAKA